MHGIASVVRQFSPRSRTARAGFVALLAAGAALAPATPVAQTTIADCRDVSPPTADGFPGAGDTYSIGINGSLTLDGTDSRTGDDDGATPAADPQCGRTLTQAQWTIGNAAPFVTITETPGAPGADSDFLRFPIVLRRSIATNGAVRSGGVTTITTAAAHGLSQGDHAGQPIAVSAVLNATFNGVFPILNVTGSNTFTYHQAGLPDATSSGGQVGHVRAAAAGLLVQAKLKVTQSDGQFHEVTEFISIPANSAPVASLVAQTTVFQCTGSSRGTVTLDGSASTDPEGDPLVYNFVVQTTDSTTVFTSAAGNMSPTVVVDLPLGTYTVQLTVSDGTVTSAVASQRIVVGDTIAPSIVGASSLVAEATVPGGASRSTSPALDAYLNFGSVTAVDACDSTLTTLVAFANGAVIPTTHVFPLGTTPVTFTALDDAQNSGVLAASVTVVDTTPPTTPTNLMAAPTLTAGAFTLSWTGSTDIVGVAAYELQESTDGGTTFVGFPGDTVLAPSTSLTLTRGAGTYRFRVRARDAAGNPSAFSSHSNAITMDLSPPTLPADQQLMASPNPTNATFTLDWQDATDTSGVTYRLFENGVQVATPAASTATLTRDQGSYTYTVAAVDRLGNESALYRGSATVVVDATPPAAPTVDVPPVVNAASVAAVAVTVTGEPGATVNVTVDDDDVGTPALRATGTIQESGTFSTRLDLSGLADGTLRASATLTDRAGNASTAGADTATKDTVAPPPPSVPDLVASSDTGPSSTDNVTSDSTPTFTGTAETNATVKLYDAGTLLGSVTADASGHWSFTTGVLSDGMHRISATAVDQAGNESARSGTLSVVVDTTTITPPGSAVTVRPRDVGAGRAAVTVTFETVTQGGDTTLVIGGEGPPLPAGFRLGDPPTYFEIATTVAFSGTVTVCVDYGGIAFTHETLTRLLHFEGGSWLDWTTSRDPESDLICGRGTSLSPFAVVEPAGRPAIAVANETEGTVSLIDGATHRVVRTVRVGHKPVAAVFFDVVAEGFTPPARLYVAERRRPRGDDGGRRRRGDDEEPGGHGAVEVLVGPAAPNAVSAFAFTMGKVVTVGQRPEGLAVRPPDGREIWTTDRNDDSVSVIDRATDTVVATVRLELEEPGTRGARGRRLDVGRKPVAIAFAPDGAHAYVVGRNSDNLIVLDAATRAIVAVVGVGHTPVALAVAADGTRVYVANRSGNTVAVVDTTAPTAPAVLGHVPVGEAPEGLALLPSGEKLYVTNRGWHSVSVLHVQAGIPHLVPGVTVPVGDEPSGIAAVLDGGFVYVANHADNTVAVIDTAVDRVVLVIPVGAGPTGVTAGTIPATP